jgi:endonuclease YncB( thermonuclease family)
MSMKAESSKSGRKIKLGSLTQIQNQYPCIKKSETIQIDGETIELIGERWWNLKTGRQVKSIHGKRFLVKPRIIGTDVEIMEFLRINNTKRSNIVFPDHLPGLKKMVIQSVGVTTGKKKTESFTAGIISKYPCTQQDETVINLADQPVVITKRKWYNLETSRQIGKIDGKLFLISPRVVGTEELLTQFTVINNLDMELVKCTDEMSDRLSNVEKAVMKREPNIIACTDIDKFPMSEIDSLKPFSFNHLTIPAIITRIIDGDTFDCALIIDPYHLAVGVPIKVKHRTVMGHNAIVCSSNKDQQSDSKLAIKLCIRLYGADAADCAPSTAPLKEREKSKTKKDLATEFVQKWSKGCNHRIWLQLMGSDCRSRTLARLYQRGYDGHKSTSDLTSKLLRYQHPVHGKVAVPYHGGNKEDAWTA